MRCASLVGRAASRVLSGCAAPRQALNHSKTLLCNKEDEMAALQESFSLLNAQNKVTLRKEKEALLQVQELYEDIDQYNEVNLRLQEELSQYTTITQAASDKPSSQAATGIELSTV